MHAMVWMRLCGCTSLTGLQLQLLYGCQLLAPRAICTAPLRTFEKLGIHT